MTVPGSLVKIREARGAAGCRAVAAGNRRGKGAYAARSAAAAAATTARLTAA